MAEQQTAKKPGRPAQAQKKDTKAPTNKKEETLPPFNNPDCPEDYNAQNEWFFEKVGENGGVIYVIKPNGSRGPRWNEQKKRFDTVPIRLCSDDPSIYVDQQTGNTLDYLAMEEGLLSIPNTYPQALDYLFAHPDYNKEFRLLNRERDAKKDLEDMEKRAEALQKARSTNTEDLKVVVSVLGGDETAGENSIKVYALKQADQNPSRFLSMFDNPTVQTRYKVKRALRHGVIEHADDAIKWVGGDVIINLTPGKDHEEEMVRFLLSDNPKAHRVGDEIENSLS